MKKLLREFEFTPEQTVQVEELARAIGVTRTTAGILYSRGMDTEEKMRAFLSPSREHFLSPLLMRGMREAVELIKQARDEEWNVAVFGDYDADGIGACAILYRALCEFGITPYLYIPERSDGYGMNIEAIDAIFDECLPDLIVTVDCGISNKREVEYIKEQGAYVIVTDHHELPEELPDCITVNPKFRDDYPYDNLCGAGVAFKLATALIGEKAYDLLDFAALSTVADSVPLTDENRDIVAEGLALIARSPRPAFTALLNKAGEITSQTLAFSLAPRINAAGRMGDARAALRLFTSDDLQEINELAEKLNLYNADRQRIGDELYNKVASAVRAEGAYSNVVMVAGENWNTGLVGIVAARIAETFARPALLFTRRGGVLRGSARSIENVNIFEALKACSQYMEEFGGHSQAAGITVKEENFAALKAALNDYIGTHYTEEDFIPNVTVVGECEDGERVAHELLRLEPFGIGNPRPLFVCGAEHLSAAPIKPASPHLSFTACGLDYMYFNGDKAEKLLRSDLKKEIVYELNLSKFRGREYLKGFVRTVLYDGTSGVSVESGAFENLLLSLKGDLPQGETMTAQEIDAFIQQSRQNCRYGLCAVAFDRASLSKYSALRGLDIEAFRLSSESLANVVLYAPDPGEDLSGFREVVFLDRPAGVGCKTGNARVLYSDICGYRRLLELDASRGTLLNIYAAIRGASAPILGASGNLADTAQGCNALGFDEAEFMFALGVFEELGLVEYRNGCLGVVRGKHVELTDSKIYARVLACQEV